MAIDRRVDIGHLRLKVSDIERSLAFHCDVLGFESQQRYGTRAAFVSAGGYHHHLGPNTWESERGSLPPRNSTGLYHGAIRSPDRRTLADALRRVPDAGIPLDGASDHDVSEALYLRDPDGNGIELYRDRPREEWPRTGDGEVEMASARLDVAGLPAELDAAADTVADGGSEPAAGSGAQQGTEPRPQRVEAGPLDGIRPDVSEAVADEGAGAVSGNPGSAAPFSVS
jgi:catechol 2,3-dioxygenase